MGFRSLLLAAGGTFFSTITAGFLLRFAFLDMKLAAVSLVPALLGFLAFTVRHHRLSSRRYAAADRLL